MFLSERNNHKIVVKNYKTKNNYFNDTPFMYRNNSPFYSVFILFHFVRVTYYFNCLYFHNKIERNC
uniref:Uncharacterized protein n=1 Tax=Heterorhabditis bacteriophora TaxID=37862 RepID=A0A1I7WHB4_HETBA